MTTSGGMLVTFTNSVSGSTEVNLVGSTGTQAVVSSVGAQAVQLMGSSGLTVIVSSSGALKVDASFSATSTASNIIGSTGTTAIVSSGGALTVSIVSSGGLYAPVTSSAGLRANIVGAAGVMAPVTSSYGLNVSGRSTGRTFGVLRTTVGAPVTQVLTTVPIWVYSITMGTTVVGTAGNAIAIYSVGTSALSTMTGQMQLTHPAGPGMLPQYIFPSGVPFTNGLQIAVSLSFGTTGTNTASPFIYNIEYEL